MKYASFVAAAVLLTTGSALAQTYPTNPEKLSYSTPGIGTFGHVAAEQGLAGFEAVSWYA